MKKLLYLSILICTTALAQDTIRIQVLTKDQTEVGEYSDAQYFTVPDDTNIGEWKAAHQDEIDAEKNARIARWVDSIKNPPPPVEPTEAELIAMKQAIIDQKTQLDAQIAEVDTKISEKAKGDIQTK